MKKIVFALLCLCLVATGCQKEESSEKDANLPGQGVKVQPARASWNTGYFQEAIVRAGLKELGYEVEDPKELTNPLFYQTVALGDVDYWTNGWFPMHDAQLPDNFYDKAEKVGYVARAGGMQGYMVSKKAAEEFNITSIADFKRPEVIEAFDANDDGKADLTACPPGWACEEVIDHHMDVYGLSDSINLIKAAYSASMADTIARFKSGEPAFFYTWTPNWTVFKLQPGEDVVWINVPEIMPYKSQSQAVERMTVEGVKGSISDPLKAGFVVCDIQVVGNTEFLNANPAAKKFLELFTLPLSDINEQNTIMEDKSEKSQADIERHAQEWIEKNREQFDAWLGEARAAA